MSETQRNVLRQWAFDYRRRGVMGTWWPLLLAVEGALRQLDGGARLGQEKRRILKRYSDGLCPVIYPLVDGVRAVCKCLEDGTNS